MERLGPRLRLYEDAFEAIRQYVVRQGLRPGDALPSERQIQEQLGIGRAPVREALRVLQSVGLIEARQGKGLFVKEMDLRPMVDAFVTHLGLIDPDSFEHLLTLRQILELGAAELAAKRRTAGDLADLRATLDAMRERIERQELGLDEDFGFHDLLIRATHNPLLEHLYACLGPFLVTVRATESLTVDDLTECLNDHAGIFDAIDAQDAGLAVGRMQAHMETVRRQFDDSSRREEDSASDTQLSPRTRSVTVVRA